MSERPSTETEAPPATVGTDLERPWNELRWVVVDVEGNGARPPELVELALVPVVGGMPNRARTWLVRPPTRITWQATRVHGIANAEVEEAPTVDAVAGEIVHWLSSADVLVGHNVGVDLGVLARSLPAWTPPPTLDTLRLARLLAPGRETYRLGALGEAFGIDDGIEGPGPHRAGYDATLTARLMARLIASLGSEPTAGEVLRITGQKAGAEGEGTLF